MSGNPNLVRTTPPLNCEPIEAITTKLLDEISRLSEAERLDLIEAIWRTLLPDGELPPLYEDEKSLLDERVRDAVPHPVAGRSWVEVKAEFGEL